MGPRYEPSLVPGTRALAMITPGKVYRATRRTRGEPCGAGGLVVTGGPRLGAGRGRRAVHGYGHEPSLPVPPGRLSQRLTLATRRRRDGRTTYPSFFLSLLPK